MTARPTVAAIKLAVAAAFSTTTRSLESERRHREAVLPRHVAMYLAVELTGKSGLAIARLFNRKDHSTVVHAHARISAMLRHDSLLADRVCAIRAVVARSVDPQVLNRIRSTSAARAVEQAIQFAAEGFSPGQAIAAAGMSWHGRSPSWEDVVWVLASAWRQRCAPAVTVEEGAAA